MIRDGRGSTAPLRAGQVDQIPQRARLEAGAEAHGRRLLGGDARDGLLGDVDNRSGLILHVEKSVDALAAVSRQHVNLPA